MSGATFTKIYLPLREVIYSVCLSLLRNTQDADDVTQDVYLKLWENRETLASVECPKAFVIRTARNRCLDRLKSPAVARNSQEDAGNLTLVADPAADPHAVLVAKEQQKRLDSWVNSLHEPKRSIFRLRQFEMLSNEETAERLGLQESTVRSTLSRLRKEVRKVFFEEENPLV